MVDHAHGWQGLPELGWAEPTRIVLPPAVLRRDRGTPGCAGSCHPETRGCSQTADRPVRRCPFRVPSSCPAQAPHRRIAKLLSDDLSISQFSSVSTTNRSTPSRPRTPPPSRALMSPGTTRNRGSRVRRTSHRRHGGCRHQPLAWRRPLCLGPSSRSIAQPARARGVASRSYKRGIRSSGNRSKPSRNVCVFDVCFVTYLTYRTRGGSPCMYVS